MLNLCAWAPPSRPALLLLFLCSLSAPVWADCPSPSSPAEFLQCASQNDPDLLGAKAELEALKASAGSAGLWQNPQLATDVIHTPGGQPKFGASWMQALPLSGEKGHAAREAALRIQASQLRLNALVQEHVVGWVLDLARLRQIDEELGLLDQEQELGQGALARLARLAYQTSEQQAATRTFQWNQKALEIARLRLVSEQAGLRQGLSTALNEQPLRWDFTLPHREDWPVFPALDTARTHEIQALELDAQAWERGEKRAAASAWPALSLGPVMETEPSADGQSYLVGGALELQIPLWDRQEGDRGAAKAQGDAARRRLAPSLQSLQGRIQLWKARYEAAIPVLKRNAHTLEDGLPGLRSIHKAYLAGRLPVSAALEAFRQYQDAVQENHSLEREALASLWQAYALSGNALEMKP